MDVKLKALIDGINERQRAANVLLLSLITATSQDAPELVSGALDLAEKQADAAQKGGATSCALYIRDLVSDLRQTCRAPV